MFMKINKNKTISLDQMGKKKFARVHLPVRETNYFIYFCLIENKMKFLI